jgi:tetratricopeptide (TPR) repeat protein
MRDRADRICLLALAALLVCCFGVAARLDVWYQTWAGNRRQSASVLGVLLGDSRRMFATHFFVKADAYFHSGYYPTIFDNREAFQTPHMAEDAGAMDGHNQGDETGFMGKPRNWIDRFSRKFHPSVHTHLDEGGPQGRAADDLGGGSQVREILPWLRLSAALDPDRVETYTVTAYWLRQRMGKIAEAEQFLREGLRANPNSYEILYELGRVYAENRNDDARARNLWEAALRQWKKQYDANSDPDKYLYLQMVSHLATLEARCGNYREALAYMELWKAHSPTPAAVQKQIEELRQKLSSASPPGGSSASPGS